MNYLKLFQTNAWKDMQHLLKKFPWHDSVKSVKLLVTLLTRASWVVVGKVGVSYSLAILAFARTVHFLWKCQGYKGLVKWLKTCHMCLMKALAGDLLRNTRSVGVGVSCTLKGLPRCIPHAHRILLRAGDPSCQRFWFSLFALYRVLEVPLPTVSLSSITNIGVDLSALLPKLVRFVPVFWNRLVVVTRLAAVIHKGPTWQFRFLPLIKSGPTRLELDIPRTSFDMMFHQALVLVNSDLWPTFKRFLNLCDYFYIEETIEALARYALPSYKPGEDLHNKGDLGRLAFKVEAAGKVRVFAIVDYFTQCLFKPLHDWVFEILKKIPQDGTHDQHKPLWALVRAGHTKCYSFDLTAATDRLPLALQVALLRGPLGLPLATTWGELFSTRDFAVPGTRTLNLLKVVPGTKPWPKSVRYAVGQPMGAYSSWALLALTHHFLVQFSAIRAGFKTWFPDYAILGDDVVICDPAVATQYQILMKELGVGLNMSKSVISTNGTTMEFAKRFIVNGVDVSGTSLKQLAAAASSLSGLQMLFTNRATDKMSSALASMLKFSGKGYKVLATLCSPFASQSRRTAWLLLFMRSPWGLWPWSPKVWVTANTINSRNSTLTSLQENTILEMFYPPFNPWEDNLEVVHPIAELKISQGFVTQDSLFKQVLDGSVKVDGQGHVPYLLREILTDLETETLGNPSEYLEAVDMNASLRSSFWKSGSGNFDTTFAAHWNLAQVRTRIPLIIDLVNRTSPETRSFGKWLTWYIKARSAIQTSNAFLLKRDSTLRTSKD
jgi:hypothetical protein